MQTAASESREIKLSQAAFHKCLVRSLPEIFEKVLEQAFYLKFSEML